MLLDVGVERPGLLQAFGVLIATVVRVVERSQPEQAAWLVVPADTAAFAEVVGEGVWPFGGGEWLGPGGSLILLSEELEDRATGRRERGGILAPTAAGQPTFEHVGKIRGATVADASAGKLGGALFGALAQALLGRSGLGSMVAVGKRLLDRACEPGDGIADILRRGVREVSGLSQHASVAERADLQVGG